MRALGGAIVAGEFKSGASTITMQTARLLYPELAKRQLSAKLKQFAIALKLEYKWTKREMLEAYFTLAPYGGNIEGIRAGTGAWLGKTPGQLSDREAALFVALPQSPETRRPDRFLMNSENATSRVLRSIAPRLGFVDSRLQSALNESLPYRINTLFYPDQHLVDRLFSSSQGVLRTTINHHWQSVARSVLTSHMIRYPEYINGGVMIVERGSGAVKAYIGSTDYGDKVRKGAINYLTTRRSSGSTLKPLIYGLALQRNLLNRGSIVSDTEMQVGGYAPTNFNEGFEGAYPLTRH